MFNVFMVLCRYCSNHNVLTKKKLICGIVDCTVTCSNSEVEKIHYEILSDGNKRQVNFFCRLTGLQLSTATYSNIGFGKKPYRCLINYKV